MKSGKNRKNRQLRNILTITGLWVGMIVITAFGGSKFTLTVCFALPIVVGLSVLMQLLVNKSRLVSLEMPVGAVQKGEKIQGTVMVRNRSFVPLYAFRCVVRCHNTFTDETFSQTVYGSVAPKAKKGIRFSLESTHCGYMQVTVEKFSVADLFCLFYIPMKKSTAEAGTPVFPSVYPVKIVPRPIAVNSLSYSDEQTQSRGQDLTQTYQLRDYTPGDALRQIHWKLTEKMDKLIVRDGVAFGRQAILVFWDTLGSTQNPDAADALADAVTSVCCALMDQGLSFDLAWRFKDGIQRVPVGRGADWNTQILEAVRYACSNSAVDLSTVDEGDSQVLYFANVLPGEYKAYQDSGRFTFFLCGHSSDKQVVSFPANRPLPEVTI